MLNDVLKKNAKYILPVLSSIGTVAAIVMATKATPKAIAKKEALKNEKGENFSKKDALISDIKTYAPTIAVATAAIGCTIGNAIISNKTQASLIGLYGFVNAGYQKYKDSINTFLEKNGLLEKSEDELAKKVYTDLSSPAEPNDGDVLIFDMFSMNYIETTVDELLAAEQYVNKRIKEDGVCSALSFYQQIDSEWIFVTDSYGNYALNPGDLWWYGDKVIFNHRTTKIDEDLNVLILSFDEEPTFI